MSFQGTQRLQDFNDGFDYAMKRIEEGLKAERHHFTIRIMAKWFPRSYWYSIGQEAAVAACERNWKLAHDKYKVKNYREAV